MEKNALKLVKEFENLGKRPVSSFYEKPDSFEGGADAWPLLLAGIKYKQMYCELDEDDFQLSPIFNGASLKGSLGANQNIYLYYLWQTTILLLRCYVYVCMCMCVCERKKN